MRGSYGTSTVLTTDTVIIGTNPNRRSLVIGNNTANLLSIAFGQAAVDGASLPIPSGTQPMKFLFHELGDIITQDVHAVFHSASGTAGWIVSEI